jgi:hypothetical protein
MRRSYALLSSLTTVLVLGACSGDPNAPSVSEVQGLGLHVTGRVCDFVTFGRLIANGIVISGNAGGNAPGGGILGEIEIHIGDQKIHAHTVTEYGRPLAGVFGGILNARTIVAVGTGGENIVLRLIDNGEPGKNLDRVFLRINGVVVLGAQTIDRGNVQLHLNCRGPGD